MTLQQQLLKVFYAIRMKITSLTGLGASTKTNTNNMTPPKSFYDLSAIMNSGKTVPFDTLKGKYVLVVNTASNCGYTGQYDDLEQLYQQQRDKLQIIGFPSNDFGGQEPGSDEKIAEFCKVNYGVTFPIFKKNAVKGAAKQPVYNWLSEPAQNGWNSTEPAWNFNKYLISPSGVLLQVYSSAVSPQGPEIINEISK
jgi:glutathione peroxidase